METVKPPVSIETLASALRSLAADPDRLEELARLVAPAARAFAFSPLYEQYFSLFQEHGFHLTPVHFYQPIPDLRTLTDELFDRESELVGIDMNDAVQLDLVRNVFPRFQAEYDSFPLEATHDPHEFYFNNGQFSGTDALALYCMLRHLKPKLVIEVGSGYSTRLVAQAAMKNGNTKVVCIEPYPTDPGRHDIFQGELHESIELITERVQDIQLSFFDRLGAGDVLFIDSSHVLSIGGDVTYLLLEVMPRLRVGVVVHLHDIFLPFEYPRDWVVELMRFYSEQYLLQAFLCFNREFEVLLCNSYLGQRNQADLRKTFPKSPWFGGGSFWIRRVAPPSEG